MEKLPKPSEPYVRWENDLEFMKNLSHDSYDVSLDFISSGVEYMDIIVKSNEINRLLKVIKENFDYSEWYSELYYDDDITREENDRYYTWKKNDGSKLRYYCNEFGTWIIIELKNTVVCMVGDVNAHSYLFSNYEIH